MDFIVACSNLRAFNYSIPPADRHKVGGRERGRKGGLEGERREERERGGGGRGVLQPQGLRLLHPSC